MPITSPYHEGERAVQTIAGERLTADRNGRAIGDSIMPGALKFIAQRRMLVLASTGADGAVWASLLTGPPGFAQAPDTTTVRLDLTAAGAYADDPLFTRPDDGAKVGMLAIDLENRRRLRVNGTLHAADGGAYELRVSEAFPNCPQYIRRRHFGDAASGSTARDGRIIDGTAVSDAHRRWIESADTLFVATAHAERGADASHRGGDPGFVRMVDDRTLRIPDYAGNGMFNTLGNIRANPHAGLLFVDFERGRTLQLTGRATLRFDLDDDPAQPTGGTARYWDFTVDRWIEGPMTHAFPTEHLDHWPRNPRRKSA
jgi:predicted pyridoxine 5'-phosphate oxidase superfamily flavin-nucleotide-binding protein